ncbi:hypothetical protein [Cellulomonas oligotrophica]|uniref:Activator of HSP90 ATPase n=1 Tax=Cellulomonas oligotrophica TaxID=931536 RepID=A0A7Y9JZ19_9CELL|nr:hypothetical protein [Cellulomonas oligotrophica]NYD86314.1 hypothetical protein [Cellulomonas oligotrophica]GIG32795.1 hypothetical protein Col01nite_19540 [Cellulomonas oligotrophica]
MTLLNRPLVTLDIEAPPATVWAHLRDARLIRRWFGGERPELDEEIRATFFGDRVRVVRSEHDAGTIHAISWPRRGDSLKVVGHPGDPMRSRVTFTRRPQEMQARHDGVYCPVGEMWTAALLRLRHALEVQPGDDRLVLSVCEQDAGPAEAPLLVRAGLSGLGAVPVGVHLSGRRLDGTPVGGKVVFRTDHQVGVALTGTSSLLHVLVAPPAHRPPHGLVTVTLSAYGLDHDAQAETVRRWDAWWAAAGVPVLATVLAPQH